MSWFEYNDMYEKAQKDGKYHLFVFDLKGSRKLRNFIPSIWLLLDGIRFELFRLEDERNIQIVHRNKDFNNVKRGDMFEPFILSGDLMGFTVLRNSITEEEVYQIFKDTKNKLGINYDFHYDNGYYETDYYEEGADKYFRGYCIQYLEHRAKKKTELI